MLGQVPISANRNVAHEIPPLPGFGPTQNRALFEEMMKALVIRASEHGIELVAELNGVRGG